MGVVGVPMKGLVREILFGGSFRGKLLLYFLLISLIPFGAASLIGYLSIWTGGQASTVREMRALADAAAQTLNVFMSDRISDHLVWAQMSMIKDAVGKAEVREEATSLFKDVLKEYQAYEAIVILDARGKCVVSSSSLYLGEDFSDTPFFRRAMKGGTYVEDMYYDSRVARLDPQSDGWTMSISVPITQGDRVVGALGSFLKWSAIEATLAQAEIGQTGYVFLVNKDREIIAHPSRAFYRKPIGGSDVNLPDLDAALKNQEPHVTYSFLNPKTKDVNYKTVGLVYPKGFGHFDGLGWKLGAGADRNEVMGYVRNVLRNLSLVGTGIAVLVVVLAVFLARNIAQPITTVAQRVKLVSEGDLTVTLPVMKTNDELGALVNAFHQMLENLRGQAQRTLAAVNVLSESCSNISRISSELVATASKSSTAVLEASSTIDRIRQAVVLSSERVNSVAERVADISETGKKAIEATALKMNLIGEKMESMSETVVRLSEQSQTIEGIVSWVQDLAQQSNVLAVNASIEAARAGDHGKGFAVVAQEVKVLADQSKEATEQIREILEDTQKKVGAVVEAARQGGKAVDSGLEQSVLAGESIRALAESVVESSESATAITRSAEQQVVGVDQIAASMSNIEQAVTATHRRTEQIDESVKKLEKLGVDLKALAQKYKIG